MNQCLVTKLKSAVDDNSLMHLGEFRIKVSRVSTPTSKTQGFSFTFNKDAKVEIVGDGYFTDKTLTENKGKTLDFTANSLTSFYVSNGDFELAVLDKYSLTYICFYAQGETGVSTEDMSNRFMSIEDLKYSTDLSYISLSNTQVTGDISALQNLTKLTRIYLSGAQVWGDISALQNLTELDYINLESTQISGDISALQNLTKLTGIGLSSTQVSGDISALQNLTALTSLRVNNCTGNLSSLSSLTKLTMLYLNNSTITGDLASIAPTCYFAGFSENNGSNLSWTTRASTSNIIAIGGNASMENIDKMLQDQAQCVVAIPSSGQALYKTISVVGNRTSASDEAVATLQEKGYTISITKAS